MGAAMTVTDTPGARPGSPRAHGGSRPLLRRDVLIGQTGQGAFLRTADDAFALKGGAVYRWIVALAPALDGSHTVAELSQGLSEDQGRMVLQLVQALFDRGFARDAAVPAAVSLDDAVLDRYRTQIRYIQHFVDDAPARFERFARSRTLVLGAGPFASAVAQTLAQNGGRVDLAESAPRPGDGDPGEGIGRLSAEDALQALDRYDVVVASTEDSSLQRIAALAAAAEQGAFQLLPVIAVGGRAYVGPLVEGGTGPGWVSYLHGLTGNLDAADAAAFWQALGGPDPVADRRLGSPQLAAVLGGMAGFEVFRLRTDCLPAETRGGVVIQNLLTLDATVEALAPHPADPVVGAAPPAAVDLEALHAGLDTVGREHGEPDPLAERAEAEAYVDMIAPYVGFLREFVDLPIDQSPLKIGRLEIANVRRTRGAAPGRVVVSDFDVYTPLKARTRAVLRAAQAHVDTWGMQAHRVVAAAPQIPSRAFATWTGGLVGAGSGLSVPAVDLLTGAATTVPAEVVYPLSRANAEGIVEPVAAGAGAGTSVAEAAAGGILGEVTYRALRELVSGRPGAVIDCRGADEGGLAHFLISSAGHLGLQVQLLDISLEGLGSTVLARLLGPGASDSWTAATDISRSHAAVVALRDLVGREQLTQTVAGAAQDLRPTLMPDLDPRRLPQPSATVPLAGDDVRPVSEILRSLARSGQVLFAETTTPDLLGAGIRTARVMVAGGGPVS